MATGYLSVETRLYDDSLPVSGAKVYIASSNAFSNSINPSSEVSESYYNYLLTTDASGNTGFIRVETPDPLLTENQNNTIMPYSLVDVYVTKEGFLPIRIKNVQIFGDTQSILPVTMLPDNGNAAQEFSPVLTFTIPQNKLMTQTQNTMKGPSETQAEPLISEDIYIPEFITVHLGTPSSNARNVTVPFTEYIKNVASSEIYPTWPEEALKANIAAIVSLTLNRYFTEWYPSQGYNFDITSTTSYDQSFVEGRNIFENISNLVDEYFSLYVTREGFINPLFTTFCDGRTVSCNGLSQWGSVSLAEQGNDALEILRYYYGEDVNLTATDDIRSSESSYPGTPLRLGDTGEDVLTKQLQLARIRENYPAIPLIPAIDGVFGSSTDAAVRTFQEIFDLPVDGIIGKATWYRISYIYSSVAKLAEVIGEGVTDIFSEDVPTVTISSGDSGNYVLLLQSLLRFISIFYPTIPAVSVDGIYGNATQNAVVQFQSTFNLSPSGVVTPTVWQSLYDVYRGIIRAITPSLANQGFPGRDLKRGDSSENVRLIQEYLNEISNIYPQIQPLTVDGFFGEATENAVLALQRALGITATGVVDVSTWERIVQLYNFLTQ